MDVEPGEPIELRTVEHACVMQWKLQDTHPLHWAHIQVGMIASSGWYVAHTGFGSRQFADKKAAWAAIRRLMSQHDGRWEQIPCDAMPWQEIRPADGTRVLYDTSGHCLHESWGRQKDQIWARYSAAIDAGRTLRQTKTHPIRGNVIELGEYADPFDGSTRYVVCDGGAENYFVTDYPTRSAAEKWYVQVVRRDADREFPYLSSDVDDVPVNSHPSNVPRRTRYGEVIYDGYEEYE